MGRLEEGHRTRLQAETRVAAPPGLVEEREAVPGIEEIQDLVELPDIGTAAGTEAPTSLKREASLAVAIATSSCEAQASRKPARTWARR